MLCLAGLALGGCQCDPATPSLDAGPGPSQDVGSDDALEGDALLPEDALAADESEPDALDDAAPDDLLAASDASGDAIPTELGFTIPGAHPRLLFSEPSVRARATQAMAADFEAEYPVDRALRYLLLGDEVAGRAAADWLADCFLIDNAAGPAHCQVSGDWFGSGACLDPDSANCDELRNDGAGAALVFDWCYPLLSAAQRASITQRMIDHLAYSETIGTGDASSAVGVLVGGPRDVPNNYFWGRFASGVLWGIALAGEHDDALDRAAFALEVRWPKLLEYGAGPGRGGVGDEGSQYGVYMGEGVATVALVLGDLGRDLFAETDFFHGMLHWFVASATTRAVPAPVGDGIGYQIFPMNEDEFWRYGRSAQRDPIGRLAVAFASLRQATPMGRVAQRYLDVVDPDRPAYLRVLEDPSATSVPADWEALPLDYVATGSGYIIARTSWQPEAAVVALQLGEPYISGHVQRDSGTFLVSRDGVYLSTETPVYTEWVTAWRAESQLPALEHGAEAVAHNAFLFQGMGSRGHYATIAEEHGTAGPPQLAALARGDDYVYSAVDLSASYRLPGSTYIDEQAPGATRLRDDNPHVAGLVREFLFIRPLEALIVVDRALARGCDASPELGLSASACVPDANAVVKTAVVHLPVTPSYLAELRRHEATLDGQAIRVTVAWPTSVSAAVVTERSYDIDDDGNENEVPLFTRSGETTWPSRLELSHSGAPLSEIVTVIELGPSSRAPLQSQVTQTEESFTLTLSAPWVGSTPWTIAIPRTQPGAPVVAKPPKLTRPSGVASQPDTTVFQQCWTDEGPYPCAVPQ